MRLWDVTNGQALKVFKGHTSYVYSVSFSPDGGRLASAGSEGVFLSELELSVSVSWRVRWMACEYPGLYLGGVDFRGSLGLDDGRRRLILQRGGFCDDKGDLVSGYGRENWPRGWSVDVDVSIIGLIRWYLGDFRRDKGFGKGSSSEDE
ncbi:MAG: hypothetical protein AAF310_01980 [Myxococcota bacterium]